LGIDVSFWNVGASKKRGAASVSAHSLAQIDSHGIIDAGA
jgi:hypothetical protein